MKRPLVYMLFITTAASLVACSVSVDLFGNKAQPTLIIPPTNPPAMAAPTKVPEPTVMISLPTDRKSVV